MNKLYINKVNPERHFGSMFHESTRPEQTMDSYVTDLQHEAEDGESGHLTDSLISAGDHNVQPHLDKSAQRLSGQRAQTSNQMNMLVRDVNNNQISSVRNKQRGSEIVQSEQKIRACAMESYHEANVTFSTCAQLMEKHVEHTHTHTRCKTLISTRKTQAAE